MTYSPQPNKGSAVLPKTIPMRGSIQQNQSNGFSKGTNSVQKYQRDTPQSKDSSSRASGSQDRNRIMGSGSFQETAQHSKPGFNPALYNGQNYYQDNQY